MSLSNPKLENPAKKFIDFKGDEGEFIYYDKVKEQKIKLEMPIYFVVLDELSTISGYDKSNDCGIYSNEVHRISDDLLNVRSFKGGFSLIGKYSDIKNELKAVGGKFCKSVYAMLITNVDNVITYELVNFKFKGGSFSAWLDKKFNAERFGIKIQSTSHEKNGAISYQIPVFESFPIKPETLSRAMAMDKVLQAYLSWYKNNQTEHVVLEKQEEEIKESQPAVIYANEIDLTPPSDDLPF